MDFRRRIRVLEKKVSVEEPREEIIDFREGQVLRISRNDLTKLLQEIGSSNVQIRQLKKRRGPRTRFVNRIRLCQRS